MSASSSFTHSKLLGFLLALGSVSAFVIQPSRHASESTLGGLITTELSSTLSQTSLYAQKKRRRRKKTNANTPSTQSLNPTQPYFDEESELPDFDLIEDIDLEEMEKAKAPLPGVTATNTNIDLDNPEVIAAMRSNAGGSVGGSTKDLIRSRNRNLENRLVVNEIVEDVPSLADYTMSGKKPRGSGADPNIGKKAARRVARRAAAIEAEPEAPEESFLDKLPFFNKDEEKEEKTPLKLLEEGTWACIYILVAWEFYINSPLFDRQGPMAPVVFTDPMTMTFLL